jgi:hypothetical protein
MVPNRQTALELAGGGTMTATRVTTAAPGIRCHRYTPSLSLWQHDRCGFQIQNPNGIVNGRTGHCESW